jgi:hypothetical protein
MTQLAKLIKTPREFVIKFATRRSRPHHAGSSVAVTAYLLVARGPAALIPNSK